MSWTLILLLAAIVFAKRGDFLEPRVPALLEQALQYAAAICRPIILLDQGRCATFRAIRTCGARC
ncbi:hypothetical protein [Chromobacterium sphagni]|uniref:hypothetical protein n=1 Tax=Chromobacterium sphagni TaxID=1903179 RepID=UPI00195EA96D|nr:hypothetical protein [Chromobacterium sphagni]